MSAQAATTSNDDGTVAEDQAKSITATIDGTTYTSGGSVEFSTFPFTTEFVYSGTTLELTYDSRETSFTFSGAVSTEITIPSQHTHVTINGMETAVDLPGLTTVIEVSDSTNLAVTLPAVTTTMDVPAETYTLTLTADTINEVNGKTYCGFNTDDAQTLADGATGSLCVPALSTVITLPSEAPALYLNAPGVTTALGIPASTTTFVPEQN